MLVFSIPTEIVELGNIEEGQFFEIRIKAMNQNKGRSKGKDIAIPEDFKKAILKILKFWYDLELRITQSEYMGETWINEGKIVELIEDQELYDIESMGLQRSNINVGIGRILVEMGFTEFKRSTSGNMRKIDTEILNSLLEEYKIDQ